MYNFAFVGLNDVTDYIQSFSLAIKTTALRGYNRRPYAVYLTWLMGRTLSHVKSHELITYYIVKILVNMLKKSSETIKDLDDADKTKKRFSPIYIYGAIYCFFVIYIGGIMENNENLNDKLFHVLYAYNLTMIVPILFFFLYVQERFRKISFFIVLFLHTSIIFYICYRHCFQPLLFTNNGITTNTIVLIEKNEIIVFILLLIIFLTIKLSQYKTKLFTLEYIGKLLFSLAMISLCAWYYNKFFSFNHRVLLNRNQIVTLSILLSFLPLFLVIFRASVGVLYQRGKIYLADNTLNFIFVYIVSPIK